MHIIVRTPDRTVFDTTAKELHLHTEEGRISIYPKHASYIGAIEYTSMNFTDENGVEEHMVAKKGIVTVSNAENLVEILVINCDRRQELTPVSAETYLQFVMERLDAKRDLTKFQIRFLEGEKIMMEKQMGKKYMK